MKRLICILLITMILSTGCTSLYKLDENKVKDVSDIITDVLINTVGQEKAEKKDSHTIASADKNAISLISSVGDISIVTHQSDDTIIKINMNSRADSKKKAEEIIDSYTYTIKEENNSIEVDTSFEKPVSGVNLTVELIIYIPSTIKDVKVLTNVGDVHLSGVNGNIDIKSNVGEASIDSSEGTYNLHVNVGDIRLMESIAIGNSEFKTSTGDINLSIDITRSDSITAETGVGDIQMTISDDAGYHAFINEFMKDERIETKDEPYTDISLTTGVGGIELK
jgi:hypothetical protein